MRDVCAIGWGGSRVPIARYHNSATVHENMRTLKWYAISCVWQEYGTLADGGAGRALFVLEPDLLERHELLREPTPAFEHRRVRALRAAYIYIYVYISVLVNTV